MPNLTTFAEFAVAPSFVYKGKESDFVKNKNPRDRFNETMRVKGKRNFSNIIDYPRHLRLSSDHESVSKI